MQNNKNAASVVFLNETQVFHGIPACYKKYSKNAVRCKETFYFCEKCDKIWKV